MISSISELIFLGVMGCIGLSGVRYVLRQQRITSGSPEAAEDLLHQIHNHWILHNQLPVSTARRMHAELSDHFDDALRHGGKIVDIVGPDVVAFADEWAETHDAPGPSARLGSRVASNTCLGFGLVMIHRTVDLLADGYAEVGYLFGALGSVLFALPITLMLPWVGRLSIAPIAWRQAVRFVGAVCVATAFVMLVGWGLKAVLTLNRYSFDPQPGRWWAALLAMIVAMAAGFYFDPSANDDPAD